MALTHVYLITADCDYCSNFVGCKSISPNRLGGAILYKAFVQLRLLMLRFSITLEAKTIDPTAVSANPTKSHSKTNNSRRNEQSIPPIMKNERPKTQQNLLKRKRYRPEHKQLHHIPNWGRAIRTGIQLPILSQARGSLINPPQRIPRGEELESRG